MPLPPDDDPSLGQDLPPRDHPVERPSQAEAEAAVRTLLRWAGEDPGREGLLDTPARVARSYRELFAGYDTDPRAYLERVFEEVGGYDELVVLKDWVTETKVTPLRSKTSTSWAKPMSERLRWSIL